MLSNALPGIELRWDFYEDLVDDHDESEEAKARIAHANAEMRCVPTHFQSFEEYHSVFAPIFLEETKAQLHRAKFAERGATEKVHHYRFSTVGDKEEYIRLTVLRVQATEGVFYNRGDVVLLSETEDPLEDSRCHALGYVDTLRGEELSVILRLDLIGETDNQLYRERSRSVAEKISQSSDWWLTKICSISTASREFAALYNLHNVNPKLQDFILNRNKVDSEETFSSFRVPEELWRCIEDNYNQFQVDAIRHARKRAGVSLCLGPPGTGKTTTILGMLSVLLSHDPLEDIEAEQVNLRLLKSYGGNYEAERMRRILAGEDVDDMVDDTPGRSKKHDSISQLMSSEMMSNRATMKTDDSISQLMSSEMISNRATMKTDDSISQLMSSEMMSYLAPGRWEDWRDKIPENPLDRLSLLAHTEYSIRARSMVRMVSMGQPVEDQQRVDKNRNRILVCAPSNAAIDEILRRIVGEGLWGKDGEKFVPNVVRLGPNVHPSLAQYSLERMAQSVNVGTSTTLGGGNQGGDQQAKVSVLRDAQIVCSTLSVAGSLDLKLLKDAKFETVVIDEASQSIELSTLIPLQLGCCRLVLVGDHKQLPATVFSRIAEAHFYNRSLFERLHQSGYPMCTLKRQMRMHPEIAQFPSDLFYGGEIENAPNILELVTAQEWSQAEPNVFGPLVFFDIEEGKETVSLQSKVNEEEALFVECLIATLMKRFPTDAMNRIVKRAAVVSPYAEQVRLITEKLRNLFGITDPTKSCPIEVNTVDGFQGREKDIIIASTVRASEGSIGFLADIRRMNVMLTRARTNMWIVGHRATLAKDPSSPWAQLVQHIDHKKKVVKVTHPIQSFFPRVLPSVEGQADVEM